MTQRAAGRRGAAVVLYVACLAFAVLGVLAFSQAYTETTTLAVARSLAARHAAHAVDSALGEAFARVVARVNDAADAEMQALRRSPIEAGSEWHQEIAELPACRQAFGSDVEFEPVQVKLGQLKLYEEQHVPLLQYRFGLLTLTAKVAARIPGSTQRVRRETTWVHELKASPAIPPEALYRHPLWIHEFPYLRTKSLEYGTDRDRTIDEGRGISRRTRTQLQAFVSQMRRSQQLIGPWLARNPDLAANPRWGQVQACTPQTQVWSGIGVPPNTFPLVEPDWPQFPHPVPPPELVDVPINNPVFFQPTGAGTELTRDQIVLALPAREDLTRIADPIRSLPRRGGRVRVSLIDWPVSGGSAIMQDGEEHYRPSSGTPYAALVTPYRDYRRRLDERLEAARQAYAAVIDPYNERLRILTNEEAASFEGETWPYVTAEFTKQRAAFVYPDAQAFETAHGSGPLTSFGIEYLDSDDDLALSSRQQMRGPGTLGVRARLTVGPLARDGDRPITLIAGKSLHASGTIQASIICPDVTANPNVSDARIQGTFTVSLLEPETCGAFTIQADPALTALDLRERFEGLAVNVSPAPTVMFGGRE